MHERALTEVVVDACVLPEVTLSGPLEIEWATQTTARLVSPPEPYSVSHVRRLILDEGVEVRLSGLNDLRLQEPVEMTGLTSEYVNRVYGKRRRDHEEDLQGLQRMSDALLRAARRGEFTLKLQATSVPQGFTLTYRHRTPLITTEPAPGTLQISPSGNQCMAKSVSQVQSWLWPFPEASAENKAAYESVLQQVLKHHWPELNPESPSLQLKTALSQAVALVRLQMEVRAEMGATQMLDVMVLVQDEEYTPIHTQLIKADQYTTSLSPSHLFNDTADPDQPLYDTHV